MDLIACSKVISANRVFLGPAIRERLGVKEGDFVRFSSDDNGNIVISKVNG